MITKLFNCIAFSAILFFTHSAQATLIDNGNSTTDTLTGFEWLDLTLTVGKSVDDIRIGGFGGYAAAGFVHASRSQLCTFWGSLGDPMGSCETSQVAGTLSLTNINSLVSVVGSTIAGDALGFFLETPTSSTASLGCLLAVSSRCVSGSVPFWAIVSPTSVVLSDSRTFAGHWLVKVTTTAAPEPATTALLALGLAGIGFSKRKVVNNHETKGNAQTLEAIL